MDRHETLRQTPDFHAHRVRRPAHFSRQSPPRLDPETDNLVEIMEQWASYFGKSPKKVGDVVAYAEDVARNV